MPAKKTKTLKKRGPREERLVIREEPTGALARLLKSTRPARDDKK